VAGSGWAGATNERHGHLFVLLLRHLVSQRFRETVGSAREPESCILRIGEGAMVAFHGH